VTYRPLSVPVREFTFLGCLPFSTFDFVGFSARELRQSPHRWRQDSLDGNKHEPCFFFANDTVSEDALEHSAEMCGGRDVEVVVLG
jgi:hypothetical protein